MKNIFGDVWKMDTFLGMMRRMAVAFYFLISLFGLGVFGDVYDASTLRFVHVLWRHGDRSPSKPSFPTDTKNNVSTWPQGWGELSKEGIKQHYDLGAYFRRRYVDSGFLSKDYNVSEIYVQSTSYNRTIMSALANIAGMYPPLDGHKWSENITWQPIPIHSMPKENDPMLWMDLLCPTYEHIFHDEIMKSESFLKLERENAEFIEFMRNKTGLKMEKGLDDVWSVFDVLKCEKIHKHELPTWVTDAVYEKMERLNDLSTIFYYHDPRLQRLRGGLLFGEIANRMEAKAKNFSSLQPMELKYYIYSAHDTTLMALLENLGVYNGHAPEYATAIIVELHTSTSTSGNYIVKLFHINETDSQNPHQLVMKDCGASETNPFCELNAFVNMARGHTPNDWYAECGIVSPEAQKIKRLTTAATVLGVLAGILFIVVIVLIWKLKRNSDDNKTRLQ